ncbi:hypothetical protein B0H13DRAFT_1924389 [Mycena leptocephala]|nr:hypothetical protein B0H13DRAFT_1924389 [Mycena leptocephala]
MITQLHLLSDDGDSDDESVPEEKFPLVESDTYWEDGMTSMAHIGSFRVTRKVKVERIDDPGYAIINPQTGKVWALDSVVRNDNDFWKNEGHACWTLERPPTEYAGHILRGSTFGECAGCSLECAARQVNVPGVRMYVKDIVGLDNIAWIVEFGVFQTVTVAADRGMGGRMVANTGRGEAEARSPRRRGNHPSHPSYASKSSGKKACVRLGEQRKERARHGLRDLTSSFVNTYKIRRESRVEIPSMSASPTSAPPSSSSLSPSQSSSTPRHAVRVAGSLRMNGMSWRIVPETTPPENPTPFAGSTLTVDNTSNQTLQQMSGMRCLAHLVNLQARDQDHQLREQANDFVHGLWQSKLQEGVELATLVQ